MAGLLLRRYGFLGQVVKGQRHTVMNTVTDAQLSLNYTGGVAS